MIHGPAVPGSYAALFFKVLDFTSITGHIHNRCCFSFGSISSFFLELFLHSSLIAYWTSTTLGSSSFSVISFCLFILFMGFTSFSQSLYWLGTYILSPLNGEKLLAYSSLSKLSILWCFIHLGMLSEQT